MTGGNQIGPESPKPPQRGHRRRHPARRTRRAAAVASGVALVGLTATIGVTSAGDPSAEKYTADSSESATVGDEQSSYADDSYPTDEGTDLDSMTEDAESATATTAVPTTTTVDASSHGS